MSKATSSLRGPATAYDFRISAVPELELLDQNNRIITKLPMNGERYRIRPGQMGQLVIDQEIDDQLMGHHHCFLLDPVSERRAGNGPLSPSDRNNYFRFGYEPSATLDGQTAGTITGIGAVDILDISILGDIVADPRRVGRRGRLIGALYGDSVNWPEGFPDCGSPRVELQYHYPVGVPVGDSGGHSFHVYLGAVAEINAKGERVVHLLVSCEQNGIQLEAALES